VLGGFWSVYWYDGRLYGTEIARGLDVLGLVPSEYLSANEIAAARVADQGGVFNPQQQFPVTWPAVPVVALAYTDQLERSGTLSATLTRDLNSTLRRAERAIDRGRSDEDLAVRLGALAETVRGTGGDDLAARRSAALAETLTGIATALR
jgi:hypothetical protein